MRQILSDSDLYALPAIEARIIGYPGGCWQTTITREAPDGRLYSETWPLRIRYELAFKDVLAHVHVPVTWGLLPVAAE